MPDANEPKLAISDALAAADPLAQPPAPIDQELMASLPSLPLRARFLVESFLAGRHRSPIKGTSPEFAEYRAYQPGDDLRRIDWRLYGRSDRLSVKQFEDENQLRVCLAFDLSASLRYSSRPKAPTKSDYARTLLGAMALLTRRQHDAVGLALLGDTGSEANGSLQDYVRPSSSLAQHHTVLERLDAPPLARTASIPDALRRLAALLPVGSLIVAASDFYTDIPLLRDALRLLHSRKIEVIGLQVLDPMEIEFASNAAGWFVDLEDGQRLPLNTAACRAGYLERFGAYRRNLEEVFREHAADFVPLRTDRSPLAGLAAYLSHRARLG